jgi:putative ABC transport system ATP-binding protein
MLYIENLEHRYQGSRVLSVEHWQVPFGSQWLILGKSGSGKSTLLHIVAGLLSPTQGQVRIGDQDISKLKAGDLDIFRAKHIGFVFQKPHFIETLSVYENLLLVPFFARGKVQKQRTNDLLARLGIEHKKNDLPQKLSQGELQRVSIARALVQSPSIILADEPTASLDDDNAHQVLALFKELSSELNATLVVATHDQRVKSQFSDILQLS